MATTVFPDSGTEFSSSIRDLKFNRGDKLIARKFILIGYLVTVAFLGSVFAWAALVPISSAAIAPGVVGKEGYRQTVQHLEGGIIHRLLVKDGDVVTAGQVVIELANVQSRADFDLLQKQKMMAVSKEAILMAAQSGVSEATLPNSLDMTSVDASVRDAIEGQIEAVTVANRLHQEQLQIIDRQIERGKQKVQALRDERMVLERSASLVNEELSQYLAMQQEGLVTRKMIFDLKRQVVGAEADYSGNRVALESTLQEINELQMARSKLVASHLESVGAQLDVTRGQLVNLDEKLSKTTDTLERTVIRAPTDGVVVNLQVNTVGGVISSGQSLLDIVPNSGKLIIEVKINPIDRDVVRVGQNAEIRFTAFNRRVTKPVQGRVALISADSLFDSVTKESYYQAKIELLENPENVWNGSEIYPGMQAEVFIVTGSRTALSYLIEPIWKSFNRAFRED